MIETEIYENPLNHTRVVFKLPMMLHFDQLFICQSTRNSVNAAPGFDGNAACIFNLLYVYLNLDVILFRVGLHYEILRYSTPT